jgi:predicted RNA-binding Zn-ribbon protein involved in translation (DUF1610 family)
MKKQSGATRHLLDLVLSGKDKEAAEHSAALIEVLAGRFECPECGDTTEKERNGDCNDADGYCCVSCGWQGYTDLGPLEVELRGHKFSLED